MDTASLHSLIPVLDGVDRWGELAPLLPLLVVLEIVLSADNAIALAAISKRQDTKDSQRLALNIGILIALFLRIILIVMANWILQFKFIQFIAAIYLLSLFIMKILSPQNIITDSSDQKKTQNQVNLLSTIVLLAVTDLAFSIDSVAAAVAISDQLILIITGAVIGVLALRFTSGLFIRWLEIYSRLEIAGYIAVGLVGLKLLVLLFFDQLLVPTWFTVVTFIVLFIWGFSNKKMN